MQIRTISPLAAMLLLLSVLMVAQERSTPREQVLLQRIDELEGRLSLMEQRLARAEQLLNRLDDATISGDLTLSAEEGDQSTQSAQTTLAQPDVVTQERQHSNTSAASGHADDDSIAAMGVDGLTVNVNVDGYYGYNFNRPFDGRNALRAYDVSGNSFAINQAALVMEVLPDAEKGRRLGGRIDLMVGQATETLQGSPANEPRPEVYRHLFQGYGSYLAPVGKGLRIDFGKWAGSLGMEGNYTTDQLNYSRSYWFNYLPFYHMGFRTSYPLHEKLTITHWFTNGANQTEDFNAFKSQALLLQVRPVEGLSANLNYFVGREERAVLGRAPRGRTHFLDSYFTWDLNQRWTIAGEADYAIVRQEETSAPRRVTGGAGYARYRFHPRFSLAGRLVRLNDRGGLFSGVTQNLNDATVTATFDVARSFQMRWEYRRDWSNLPFFRSADPGFDQRQQNTALMGLVWRFGAKQGAW